MAFTELWYMMEAVMSPLGHIKERQVGVDRPIAMHQMALGPEHFWVADFGWEDFWPPQMTEHSALLASPTI